MIVEIPTMGGLGPRRSTGPKGILKTIWTLLGIRIPQANRVCGYFEPFISAAPPHICISETR